MTTKLKIAAALVAGTVAVPAFAYWVQLPASDLLADKLRSYGFYAINPPSTLVDVGSLYYVSEDGRQYTGDLSRRASRRRRRRAQVQERANPGRR